MICTLLRDYQAQPVATAQVRTVCGAQTTGGGKIPLPYPAAGFIPQLAPTRTAHSFQLLETDLA